MPATIMDCQEVAHKLNDLIRENDGTMRWMAHSEHEGTCEVRLINVVSGATISRERMTLEDALHRLVLQQGHYS